MNKKYWKPMLTILLILFAVAFLWNGFLLYLAGFVRVHTAVEITDKNRDSIIALMQENAEEYSEIPNMQEAVRMEYLALIHKSEVTVFYGDETTHRVFIEETDAPLAVHLQEEGYNLYFRSTEFLIDLLKLMVSLALTVVSAMLLIKKRSKG